MANDITYNGGWIDEVVCTPDENYINDRWDSDTWDRLADRYGLDSDVWDDPDIGDLITNKTENNNDAKYYSLGVEAMNKISDSVENSTALYFEAIQDSKGFITAEATTIGTTYQSLVIDVINSLKADVQVLTTLGKSCSVIGSTIGLTASFIALTDGDITTSDVLGACSAICGAVGTAFAISGIGAPIALGLDGLSFVFGLVAFNMSHSSKNSSY